MVETRGCGCVMGLRWRTSVIELTLVGYRLPRGSMVAVVGLSALVYMSH